MALIRRVDERRGAEVNYIDLFSGIGGFALGAHMAGMKFDAHYFSEVDPWAVDLYQKRFPDAIPLGDIREIDGKALADTVQRGRRNATQERQVAEIPGDRPCNSGIQRRDWIITGGFPCQDISFAGKGAGLEGSRSGLWYEYRRLIGELRPRFAIMENVGALVVRGLTDVLGSLTEIGYDAEWQDIRASDVGAPHRRERIWIVAYPGSGWRPDDDVCARRDTVGRGCEDASDTGSERTARAITSETTRARVGYDNWWAIEPSVCGMADGVSPELHKPQRQKRLLYEGRLAAKQPGRVDRLRGLGNSIVPQIVELLFRQIKEDL